MGRGDRSAAGVRRGLRGLVEGLHHRSADDRSALRAVALSADRELKALLYLITEPTSVDNYKRLLSGFAPCMPELLDCAGCLCRGALSNQLPEDCRQLCENVMLRMCIAMGKIIRVAGETTMMAILAAPAHNPLLPGPVDWIHAAAHQVLSIAAAEEATATAHSGAGDADWWVVTAERLLEFWALLGMCRALPTLAVEPADCQSDPCCHHEDPILLLAAVVIQRKQYSEEEQCWWTTVAATLSENAVWMRRQLLQATTPGVQAAAQVQQVQLQQHQGRQREEGGALLVGETDGACGDGDVQLPRDQQRKHLQAKWQQQQLLEPRHNVQAKQGAPEQQQQQQSGSSAGQYGPTLWSPSPRDCELALALQDWWYTNLALCHSAVWHALGKAKCSPDAARAAAAALFRQHAPPPKDMLLLDAWASLWSCQLCVGLLLMDELWGTWQWQLHASQQAAEDAAGGGSSATGHGSVAGANPYSDATALSAAETCTTAAQDSSTSSATAVACSVPVGASTQAPSAGDDASSCSSHNGDDNVSGSVHPCCTVRCTEPTRAVQDLLWWPLLPGYCTTTAAAEGQPPAAAPAPPRNVQQLRSVTEQQLRLVLEHWVLWQEMGDVDLASHAMLLLALLLQQAQPAVRTSFLSCCSHVLLQYAARTSAFGSGAADPAGPDAEVSEQAMTAAGWMLRGDARPTALREVIQEGLVQLQLTANSCAALLLQWVLLEPRPGRQLEVNWMAVEQGAVVAPPGCPVDDSQWLRPGVPQPGALALVAVPRADLVLVQGYTPGLQLLATLEALLRHPTPPSFRCMPVLAVLQAALGPLVSAAVAAAPGSPTQDAIQDAIWLALGSLAVTLAKVLFRWSPCYAAPSLEQDRMAGLPEMNPYEMVKGLLLSSCRSLLPLLQAATVAVQQPGAGMAALQFASAVQRLVYQTATGVTLLTTPDRAENTDSEASADAEVVRGPSGPSVSDVTAAAHSSSRHAQLVQHSGQHSTPAAAGAAGTPTTTSSSSSSSDDGAMLHPSSALMRALLPLLGQAQQLVSNLHQAGPATASAVGSAASSFNTSSSAPASTSPCHPHSSSDAATSCCQDGQPMAAAAPAVSGRVAPATIQLVQGAGCDPAAVAAVAATVPRLIDSTHQAAAAAGLDECDIHNCVVAAADSLLAACSDRVQLLGCGYNVCDNLVGPSELTLVSQRYTLCQGCRVVRYCCPDCQQEDWPQHWLVCRQLAAAVAALGSGVSSKQAGPAAGSRPPAHATGTV